MNRSSATRGTLSESLKRCNKEINKRFIYLFCSFLPLLINPARHLDEWLCKCFTGVQFTLCFCSSILKCHFGLVHHSFMHRNTRLTLHQLSQLIKHRRNVPSTVSLDYTINSYSVVNEPYKKLWAVKWNCEVWSCVQIHLPTCLWVFIGTLAVWQEPRSPKMTSCHSALHNRLKCSDFYMRVRRKGPDVFEMWVVFFNIGRKYRNSLTSEKGIKRCRKEMSYTLLCGSSRKLHARAARFLVSSTSFFFIF